MGNVYVEANSLNSVTGEKRVLFQNIDFKVLAGELLFISGPNGSGKSTLLKMILGQIAPTHGKVRVHLPQHQIAYIPQVQNSDIHLPLTLFETIEIHHPKRLKNLSITSLGLLTVDHLKLTWKNASGGEKQRTLLTSSLLQDPKLLILDEPLNHLDKSSRSIVLKGLIDFMLHGNDRSIILVSHIAIDELQVLKPKTKNIVLHD